MLEDNDFHSLGVYPILSAVQNSNALRILNLNGNALDDTIAVWLANVLDATRALTELHLARNSLTEKSLGDLSSAIASNDTIDYLDLSWNKIRGPPGPYGGTPVGVFAKALKENVRLKVLNLAWNGLGPDGGCAFADMLQLNEVNPALFLKFSQLIQFSSIFQFISTKQD